MGSSNQANALAMQDEEDRRRPILVRIVAPSLTQGQPFPGRSTPYTVQRVALKGTDEDGHLKTADVDDPFPVFNIGRLIYGGGLTLCYPIDGGGWVIDLA